MSGPKVTVYTLTQRQREALAAERLRRQKEAMKRQELCGKAAGLKVRLKKLSASIGDWMSTAETAQEWLNDSGFQDSLCAFSQSISNAEEEISKVEKEMNLSILERRIQALSAQVAALEGQKNALAERESHLALQVQEELNENISGLFSTKETLDEPTPQAESLEIVKRQGREKLLTVRENPHLPIPFQREIDTALARFDEIQEANFLENYIAIELQPLFKRCVSFLSLWEKHGEEYQRLYLQYEALLEETGAAASAKMIPFDEDAIVLLQNEIAELEEAAQKAAEQSYIAQALEEVMDEMGYDLWGERDVSKRSGKSFHNALYHFGENTAINVTYSDSGQISMELGKVDRCDRLPTGAEGQAMESEMFTFCDRFEEIEARLSEKGVQLGQRVMLAKPSAEYAQIINLNDYDVREDMAQAKKTAKRPHQQERHLSNGQ